MPVARQSHYVPYLSAFFLPGGGQGQSRCYTFIPWVSALAIWETVQGKLYHKQYQIVFLCKIHCQLRFTCAWAEGWLPFHFPKHSFTHKRGKKQKGILLSGSIHPLWSYQICSSTHVAQVLHAGARIHRATCSNYIVASLLRLFGTIDFLEII